jgi:hypothetical protein
VRALAVETHENWQLSPLGKIRTTWVRRLISLFSRSSMFGDLRCLWCWRGSSARLPARMVKYSGGKKEGGSFAAGGDIFIPDVSFVARTEAGKFIPNPNVMTEYGYALHAKPYSAMMPVMNIAFGPPEELPFDMATWGIFAILFSIKSNQRQRMLSVVRYDGLSSRKLRRYCELRSLRQNRLRRRPDRFQPPSQKTAPRGFEHPAKLSAFEMAQDSETPMLKAASLSHLVLRYGFA